MQYFDNGESIDTNIINLFFSVTGALFEETQYILHRDMKNITGANAILTGLASLERPYYVELLQESQIKKWYLYISFERSHVDGARGPYSGK